MTTEPSLQVPDPSTPAFNYSNGANDTSSPFRNISFENTTSWDYYYTQGDTLRDYPEFEAALWINKYYLYIICALGVPGNIACIVTLTSMKPFVSYSVYMLTLAITDIISITIKLIYLQITANDIQIGNVSCQLIFFIGTISQQYSNWILVAMTMERFVAIWFPFRVKTICTTKSALIVNAVMVVVFVVANWHFLLTFEEVPDPMLVWDCRPKPKYANFINFVWYWIDGTLYAFLPILIIVVLNGLIIYAVMRATRTRNRLANKSTRAQERATQQRQMTVMLLTVSIVFIILVLPNCIFFIVKEYWSYSDTVHGTARYFFLYQIVFVLSDLNHAINFYLYCLSGKRFRQSFFKLMCCCRKGQGQCREETRSCYVTVDQSRSAAGETSFTNTSPVSTPHHLLQASTSNDSVLTDISENTGHI